MTPMATKGYKLRKVSMSERSRAASHALTAGTRVRITPGQGKAILDARPAKVVKREAK